MPYELFLVHAILIIAKMLEKLICVADGCISDEHIEQPINFKIQVWGNCTKLYGNLAAPLISFKLLSVSPFIDADSDPQGDKQRSSPQLVQYGSGSGSSNFTSMRIRLCRHTFLHFFFLFLKILFYPKVILSKIYLRTGWYKNMSEKIGIRTRVIVFIFSISLVLDPDVLPMRILIRMFLGFLYPHTDP